MGERRAYLGCSLQLPLRAQAQSHSNASVARWLELTSRASASWPALCATITPALGPELGTTHVNQVEPGPEVHAHARPAGWARRFFPRRGSYQVLPHKIPQRQAEARRDAAQIHAIAKQRRLEAEGTGPSARSELPS